MLIITDFFTFMWGKNNNTKSGRKSEKCSDQVCSCIPSEVISSLRHRQDQMEVHYHYSLHLEALHSLSDTYITGIHYYY